MPKEKDPSRVARGRIGAALLHARYDGLTITAVARAKREQQFVEQARAEAEVRGEKLSDAELVRRAGYLRKAHMLRMQYASIVARARSKKKAADAGTTSAAEGVATLERDRLSA